jgi:hypothetical protein
LWPFWEFELLLANYAAREHPVSIFGFIEGSFFGGNGVAHFR